MAHHRRLIWIEFSHPIISVIFIVCADLKYERNHLRTWLNGVLAADLIDRASAKGFIALTVSGSDGQVKWRNLRIKALARIFHTTARLRKSERER